MKLIKQNIEQKDGSGTATLLPEEPEDMWHAYNLIRPSDLLRASAIRRVTTESATGSSSSQRVHMTLTLRVTSLDFDPQAAQLHVSGRVAEENKHVKLGSYHTLDLELQRNFTLEKNDGWDSIALSILKDSLDQTNKAELWAVVMQEGLANICLITTHQTILRQQITLSLPKKRPGKPTSDHDKALSKFYTLILDSLLRQLDLTSTSDLTALKPVLLASPGFLAQGFQSFLKTQSTLSTTSNQKALAALSAKTLLAHSASGHLHSLAQVLSSPSITAKLSDTRFARETALIDTFYALVRADDGRAWYGPREVEACVDKGAVGRGGGVLLISDALFRAQDVDVRRRWVALVDRVQKDEGGEVRVLSSMHESGRRLEGLGGIAAILTFPLTELDLDDDDEGRAEGGQQDSDDGDRVGHASASGIEGRRANHEEDFEF